MTLIRFTNEMGTYLLRDPQVMESRIFGPCFQARYRMEGERVEGRGTFPLRDATCIEPVPEQLEMERAA